MQTMRGQSTLTFNKNSSIHLKFQFCDIIPPDTGKTTLLLVPSGGQSSLFSCVCVCSAKLSTSVQASRCYWKATIRRKPACKKTENSFSLYVNLRGGKREKKKKREGANNFSSRFIFHRNVTVDKVEDRRPQSEMNV